MSFRQNLLIAAIGFFVSMNAHSGGRTVIASTGPSRVQLLELYSSESCSSCPPADQWVSQLKDQPSLWKTFVPVVFHVDYWNYLGWKDKLSSQAMSDRQVEIAKLWPQSSVYTPAIVVDGKEWRDWRDSRNHALPSESKSFAIALTLIHESDDTISVKVERSKISQKIVVRIAQLGMGLSSKITGGENTGRLLKHDFVVLKWQSKTLATDQSVVNFKLLPTDQKTSKNAISAWVEEEGNPTPLQAVGGYL